MMNDMMASQGEMMEEQPENESQGEVQQEIASFIQNLTAEELKQLVVQAGERLSELEAGQSTDQVEQQGKPSIDDFEREMM